MKDINFELIGRRIKETRIAKKLTQEYLAEKANVNTSHISNIENNHVKVSLSTLICICNAMNVTVDYILSSEYTSDSQYDNEILKLIHQCTDRKKQQIIQIIEILNQDVT